MAPGSFREDFKHDAVAQITERGYPVAEVPQRLISAPYGGSGRLWVKATGGSAARFSRLVALISVEARVAKATLSMAALASDRLPRPLATTREQKRRNERLQHLRGLGAILVLLFHAAYYLAHFRGDARFTTVFSGFLGTYGVAIFFALSGYLMAAASLNASAARFLLDRIVRIYPLLIIAVALTSIGLWLTGFPRRPDGVALLLAPAGPRDYILGVEWTLLFEMTYYVLIAAAMALRLRRLLSWIFGAWLGWLAAVCFLGLAPEQTLTPTFTALFGQAANSAFLIGFLLKSLPIASTQARPIALPLALAAVVVAAVAPLSPEAGHRWLAASSGALLLLAALSAPPVAPSLGSWIFSKLGNASYALYLVHVPVILISQHFLSEFVPTIIVFLLWIFVSIAVAAALAPLDVALHQLLKASVRLASARTAAYAALLFVALFLGVSLYQQYRIVAASDALEQARNTLLNVPPASKPSLLAAIDSAALLPDGRLIARGYAIDLLAPDDDSHIVIEQAGRVVAIDRMTRMRPLVARSSNRSDLIDVRFGFAAVTATALECDRGPLTAKVILSSETVVVIDSGAMGPICSHADGKPGRNKP
ncbi:MAG: hypothetical protein B7Z40_22265 [Bosea sp. 12-68-7]|nr:MAG: hypothetical protein B7Z40_22265 [Bosea sp. 12-68-7]